MTANFACSQSRSTTSSRRSTMASQPSVYNEERNLLRLRAWEQRNQDSNQAKGLNHENVPLFGEPYKINKGDELSNRIQRMLGSYEDVNTSSPLTMEPLPIPGCVTAAQSDQCQPNTDKSTKAPFHHQVHYVSTSNQKCSGYSSQSVTVSDAFSPHHHGHPSTSSKISLNQGQDRPTGNSERASKSEVLSDVMTDDDKPQQFPHSHNCQNNDMDTRDTLDGHQESSAHPSNSVDLPTPNTNLSPKESSLTQATKTSALPSQTFPPLLPSKQPSVVMTQKPTAYVRPMDGQDQVISDSPELKPSPEPYAPLPEIINKSHPGKMKALPPLLTKTNEALCVEDILREMTHAWPPLLTALHTPSVEAPSKSPFSAKEAERVSSCPAQNSSQVVQPSSLSSSEAAHSSGVESATSSDSDSSSRSESDSESTAGEPSEPSVNSSVKPQANAPAVSHGDWQLGNWIRSNQQNPNTVHVSESTAHGPLPSTPSSKHSSVEVVGPCRDSKPQLPNLQKELVDDLNKPRQHGESHENNCYQNSSHNCPSLDFRKQSCTTHTKPAKEDRADRSAAAVSVKCEETSVAKDKGLGFTDRPKVKTKHCRKSKEKDSKKESKRTTKHAALNKPKAGPELDVKPGPQSGCASCGKRHPDLCSCPIQSLARSDHLSLEPPVKINKPKAEKTGRKDSKKPHKTAHSQPETSKGVVKPPRLLVVKIDLSLLSRVPHTSGNLQEVKSNAKKAAPVVKPKGTHDPSKKSSKVELDSKPHHGKKRRLEENTNSSTHGSTKLQSCSGETEDRGRKKIKKNPATSTHKEAAQESKSNKRSSAETGDLSREKVKRIDSGKHKKRSGKASGNPHSEKSLKSSLNPSSSQSNKEVSTSRPLLKFEDRQYPVKHYVKEAKKLKHKADAESDKLSKAFNYLEAAMFFVESGIAMEKDPQISMSSYTMFADTVDLLKFVLKLKSSTDSSAPPSERDFIALCLKCQSLLQMAMFRHKYKTALKYSKTLADHFTTSHQTSVNTSKFAETPSPMADAPSPANTSTSSSSGPGSNHGGGGGSGVGSTVVPQGVEQLMFTYINITALFMGAHEMWEQAEAMAQRGSGLLSVLDSSLGPLTLTSSMNTMVRYMRQGIHWLRLDSQKVK